MDIKSLIQRIIDSDISGKDLQIVLQIIRQWEEEQKNDNRERIDNIRNSSRQ